MPRIIERYLIKELLKNFAVVVAALMLIQLAFTLRQYLDDAAAGQLPASALLTLVGLFSMKYITLLVPLALFVALMLTLGRWYRDSEMAALVACGGGLSVLLRPIGVVCLGLLFLLSALAFEISPWAMRLGKKAENIAREAAAAGLVEAGRFRSVPNGRGVFYVGKKGATKDSFDQLFVQLDNQDKYTVVTAASGRIIAAERGERVLELDDGNRYEGLAGSNILRVVNFKQHRLRLVPPRSDRELSDPRTQSTKTLFARADSAGWAELHWRLAIPLSLVGFALAAVPLARTPPRSGRLGRLLPGLLLFLVYYNLLGVGRDLLDAAKIPAFLGLWWAHGLFIMVLLALYADYLGWRMPWHRPAKQPTEDGRKPHA